MPKKKNILEKENEKLKRELKFEDEVFCPYCREEENLIAYETCQTCMGGSPDRNHYSKPYRCMSCGKLFEKCWHYYPIKEKED